MNLVRKCYVYPYVFNCRGGFITRVRVVVVGGGGKLSGICKRGGGLVIKKGEGGEKISKKMMKIPNNCIKMKKFRQIFEKR